MADYISYWKSVQVRMAMEEAREGQLLDHAASKQFGKVRPGDTVWIVNIEKGTHRFLLVGRIEVAQVCSRRAAQRALGRDNLYENAPLHIVAIPGSEEPAREVPLDPIASQLRFISPNPSDRLTITNCQIDQQQVRRLRELTPETVDLLEHVWRQASGGDARRSGNPGEECVPSRSYLEGSAVRVLVNRYERDRAARDACIRHYGPACQICGFDFEVIYGAVGRGFIHVHHLVPLSKVGRRYSIDPISDLRPVCPNCHAMLHKEHPTCTIEQLRSVLRSRDSIHAGKGPRPPHLRSLGPMQRFHPVQGSKMT